MYGERAGSGPRARWTARAPNAKRALGMTDVSLTIAPETAADADAIERLHERTFGPGRYAKTAYRIREGGAHALLAFALARGVAAVGVLVGPDRRDLHQRPRAGRFRGQGDGLSRRDMRRLEILPAMGVEDARQVDDRVGAVILGFAR